MPRRSKSSQRWLQEHFADPYVLRAQAEGYRSRAVYKLAEIDQRDGLFRAGQRVVDLGAAPGGWSQYAVQRLGPGAQLVASDLLDMEPIAGVQFVCGDFREPEVLAAILQCLAGQRADLVLSDIAPNLSGTGAIDQPRAMYLCELAFAFALQTLQPDGVFLVKVLQGEGSDALLREMRLAFRSVRIRKPAASRPRSREVYVLASGVRGV